MYTYITDDLVVMPLTQAAPMKLGRKSVTYRLTIHQKRPIKDVYLHCLRAPVTGCRSFA